MKLHTLEMRGFGPFARETKIDFQPFQMAPILLIHGRTGAGKTSVLDAVTYALYGRASGMDGRTPDTLRSHMIEETEETEVKLVFQLRNQRYRAVRSPEYMRRKKRGEGLIKESPTALLERWETDHWTPIATRVSEVNQRVESLLGFSYEQFTQVLILPQGKFRQMLIADSVQRRDIFRQLFKTGDLEALQQRMREDTSKKRKEIEEKKIRIEELFGQLTGNDRERMASMEEAKTALAVMESEIKALDADLVRDRETLKGIRAQRDRVMQTMQIKKSLEIWEKKIQDLTSREDEIKALECKRNLGERAQEIRGEKEARDRASKQEEMDKSRLGALTNRMELLQGELQGLPDEEALQEEIHALKERARILNERKEVVKKLNAIEGRQESLAIHLAKSRHEQKVFEEQKQILSDRLKAIQSEIRREIAYSLAKALEDGSPCPVCGSVHHPNLAESVTADSEAEPQLASEIDALEGRVEKTLKQIRVIEEENAQLEGGKKGFLEQLEALPETGKASETAIKKQAEACQTTMESARKIREKRTALKGQILLAEEQWKNQKAALDMRKAEWTSALSTSGFATEEAYSAAACSYAELQSMNRSIQQYQLDLAEAKRQVVALMLQLKQRGADDGLDLTELDQMVKDWTKAIDEKMKNLAAKSSQRSGFERNVNRLESEIQSKEELEKAFGALAWMADVASGRNSQGMDFEQYVLRRYLAEVLRVANQRLSVLTDGRYELAMQDERRDRRRRFGLELDVFDFYTGDTRPVGSLSGGESFKASLALALAMSDAVRAFAGGIELETLFIDEGFGTLDPSSLDQAIEVLAELKQQNRLVGIISHVPELKERIDNRIEVVKNRGKQGSRIQIHLPGGAYHEAVSVSGE